MPSKGEVKTRAAGTHLPKQVQKHARRTAMAGFFYLRAFIPGTGVV